MTCATGSRRSLRESADVTVYCQVGQRGYLATRILLQNGYRVRNLAGGFKTWLLYVPAAKVEK